MTAHRGWIGVDLDGTLAVYDRWRGIEHIGAPIELMVRRVLLWLAEGEDVRIFTARVDGGQAALAAGNLDGEAHRDVEAVRGHIEAWCLEHLGVVLPVTNIKDYGMRFLYDDRAIQVEPNTGRLAVESELGRVKRALNAMVAAEGRLLQIAAMHTGLHQCGTHWWTDDPSYLGTVAKLGPCPTRAIASGLLAEDVVAS